MTFSPYNRGGSVDKQPRYTVEKLSDYGWQDTGETVDGYRQVFWLGGTEATLYREQGGCVVNVGGGMTKFFPPSSTLFADVTEWVWTMCPEPMSEVDTYGLEARG